MDAASFNVPRITTERLLLRELRLADFEAYAADMADPAASRHAQPVDRRQAWRLFAAAIGAWALTGAGWWAVELRETGQFTGQVGAFYRENAPDLEIGWRFFREFRGQGFAKESARAALAHGFATQKVGHVIANIDADNEPSIRVATHIGMTFDKDVDFYGETLRRYRVDRPRS